MKVANLKKITPLSFFTKETLRQIEPSDQRLNFNLKYWLKAGTITQLKKGVYILKERWEKEPNKELYFEYLANKLYEPSYLSLEYVMNKYSLLSEAVFGITSITTKTTKTFVNKLGSFSYYSCSPRLFTGYEVKQFASASILIAKKPKAVFDFLYLRFLKKTPINPKTIDELRINWENITRKEFQEIVDYASLAKSKRVKTVIKLIKRSFYA